MTKSEKKNGKTPKPTKEEMTEIIAFVEKEIIKYKKKAAKQKAANGK